MYSAGTTVVFCLGTLGTRLPVLTVCRPYLGSVFVLVLFDLRRTDTGPNQKREGLEDPDSIVGGVGSPDGSPIPSGNDRGGVRGYRVRGSPGGFLEGTGISRKLPSGSPPISVPRVCLL